MGAATNQAKNFIRAMTCRWAPVLGGLAALALLAAPNPAQAQTCDPFTFIQGNPASPFQIPSNVINVTVAIGSGPSNTATTMTIPQVDYALDCFDDGTLPVNCGNDGSAMSFLGNITRLPIEMIQ